MVLAVVLVLLLQLVLRDDLRRSEARLEEADERLVQVLPRCLRVQKVPLVRVDLDRTEGAGLVTQVSSGRGLAGILC